MVNLTSSNLEGDGIHPDFFHRLWIKNRNLEQDNLDDKSRNSSSQFDVRIPDTVIFRLGQPLNWYFTNERNNRATILKKRKRNLNIEKIEQVFLRKAKSSFGGNVSDHAIVAYFIASKESTSRNRVQNGLDSEIVSCDIEYFDRQGLHDFLHKNRNNQSGILQRFLSPSGGGRNNAQIQAICTPKMCILERRKNKYKLDDCRYGLYERAVTFEGPELYSTNLPIQGTALTEQLQDLCSRIINDMTYTPDKSISIASKQDLRMILNLKIDHKEKVWILYSTSIRAINTQVDVVDDVAIPQVDTNYIKKPLNMKQLVTLAPSIKLDEHANHDSNKIISNRKDFIRCPSCNKLENKELFQPVLHKTIIFHYEKFMEIHDPGTWPPSKGIIKTAGNVGFGCIINDEPITEYDKRQLIPPVIRSIYPRLHVDGYQRYRSDCLFLHKECKVCECCFLSYAELASNGFQMTKPVEIHDDISYSNLLKIGKSKKSKTHDGTGPSAIETKPSKVTKDRGEIKFILADLVIDGPKLPNAILNPPMIKHREHTQAVLGLPYFTDEPLIHLINLEAKKRKFSIKRRVSSEKMNPYEVPLKIVDHCATNKRQHASRKLQKETASDKLIQSITSSMTKMDRMQDDK